MAKSTCTAFAGSRRIASGDLTSVAAKVKETMERDGRAVILIFDDATSEPIELDTRGTVDDVLRRLAVQPDGAAPGCAADPQMNAARRGPGRP